MTSFCAELAKKELSQVKMEGDSLPDIQRDAITNSFWVARVPSAVFSSDPDVSLKSEFEAVFRVYDEEVQFKYLKSFKRVRVIYSTEEQAQLAQDNLNNHIFEGDHLKLCPVKPIVIGEPTLALPMRTHQFLISPPASPPVGWEQTAEAAPTVDFTLVTALAKLQIPGDTQELHEGTATQPSIVVVTPEGADQEEHLKPAVLRNQAAPPISSLPPSLVHTPRPPIKN